MTAPSLHDRLEPVAWRFRSRDGYGTWSYCPAAPDYLNPAAYIIEPLYGPEAAEKIRALEEGLRPFAKAGELFDNYQSEWPSSIYNPAAGSDYAIDSDHLRHARSLLSTTTAGDDQ